MTTPTEVKHLFNEDQISSANAYFDVDIDGEAVKLQITARFGSTPQVISDQVKAIVEGYRMARQNYPRPVNSTAHQPTEPNGEKKYEPKPVKHEGLPEGMEAFKEDFDEIEITPQADEKVTVAFYRDGLKFPVGAKINKWKIQNAAQSLNVLGELDLTKAAKVRVAGTQYYTNGSSYINSKNEKAFYKDIRLVEARF